MPFTTVQVRTELCLEELCALYWDALIDKLAGDARMAQHVVNWGYGQYTAPATVRKYVREWLTWYGERSVECGPKNDFPDPDTSSTLNMIRGIVAKAFKIVY